jgi:ABC-2 type transport system permease protein
MDKIWVIVRKEWLEVFKNRLVLFTVAFLPLMLTALPLIILGTMRSSGGLSAASTSDMPASFARLCAGLQGNECDEYFFVSMFMLLFMLMPLAIPVTIASYSIVGEKTTRTLEPLLATPIRTSELLAGKGLAAVLPAIGATWGAFLIFAIGARLLAVSPAVAARLIDPLWLLAVLVVGPLLAVAAVSAAVMVSSRVSDPRVAEQLSMLVILPVLGLIFGQMTGLVLINETLILWLAGALVLVDVALGAVAVQLFQRENILTRWR